MLKKRAKGGVQTLVKCENCGEKVKVLFESNGKKICKQCLEIGGK